MPENVRSDLDPVPDWGKVELSKIREVIRLAELNLQHQAQVAQSIDQRATGLVGVTSAAATALTAFAATQWLQGHGFVALLVGCAVAAAAWYAASLCATVAITPRRWSSAGAWPRQLYGSLEGEAHTEAELAGAMAEQLDDYLSRNHDRNQRASAALRRAAWAASAAPLAGFAAGSITQLLAVWVAKAWE